MKIFLFLYTLHYILGHLYISENVFYFFYMSKEAGSVFLLLPGSFELYIELYTSKDSVYFSHLCVYWGGKQTAAPFIEPET